MRVLPTCPVANVRRLSARTISPAHLNLFERECGDFIRPLPYRHHCWASLVAKRRLRSEALIFNRRPILTRRPNLPVCHHRNHPAAPPASMGPRKNETTKITFTSASGFNIRLGSALRPDTPQRLSRRAADWRELEELFADLASTLEHGKSCKSGRTLVGRGLQSPTNLSRPSACAARQDAVHRTLTLRPPQPEPTFRTEPKDAAVPPPGEFPQNELSPDKLLAEQPR